MPAADRSFLAAPAAVEDWRLIVVYDAVAGAGVFAALPGPVATLAEATGLDPHGLRVALDALARYGVVARDDAGSYRAGDRVPSFDEAATLRHHARAIRRWSAALPDRLRGAPADRPAMVRDPEAFLDALAVNARRSAAMLVDACLDRFPGARRVLDLGGGHGEYSLAFARRGLEVTMQDLPPMIGVVAGRGALAAAGITLFTGSFFDRVPDGPFDLAFCTGITHTFDGERNVTLYRNLRPVVASGGGVAIATMLRGSGALADLFAVQMYANGNGGDTHGEEEYRRWLHEAGFRADDVVATIADRPQSLLFAV